MSLFYCWLGLKININEEELEKEIHSLNPKDPLVFNQEIMNLLSQKNENYHPLKERDYYYVERNYYYIRYLCKTFCNIISDPERVEINALKISEKDKQDAKEFKEKYLQLIMSFNKKNYKEAISILEKEEVINKNDKDIERQIKESEANYNCISTLFFYLSSFNRFGRYFGAKIKLTDFFGPADNSIFAKMVDLSKQMQPREYAYYVQGIQMLDDLLINSIDYVYSSLTPGFVESGLDSVASWLSKPLPFLNKPIYNFTRDSRKVLSRATRYGLFILALRPEQVVSFATMTLYYLISTTFTITKSVTNGIYSSFNA